MDKINVKCVFWQNHLFKKQIISFNSQIKKQKKT